MKNKLAIHFVGANGFPCAVYTPIFHAINQRRITLHDPEPVEAVGHDVFHSMKDQNDWRQMIRNLTKDIESRNKPVIGFGHSLGGSLMICAAYQKPELFSQLIVVGNVFDLLLYTYV